MQLHSMLDRTPAHPGKPQAELATPLGQTIAEETQRPALLGKLWKGWACHAALALVSPKVPSLCPSPIIDCNYLHCTWWVYCDDLKMQNKGKVFYFFKKQRKGRLYNRFRATTGLAKLSMILSLSVNLAKRQRKKPRIQGTKDKGSAKTVNVRV